MATLFTMTLDTEEEWSWHSAYPAGGYTLDNIRELPVFQERCAKRGVRTTYFTNWAVLNDPVARSVILDLAAQEPVEIGMHIHPWYTPPLDADGVVGPRESFLHNLPADRIVAKLATVYDLFSASGLQPTAFRGGRYSTGGPIHEFLRSRGFVADASVLPFTTWDDDGAPDFRRFGNLPERTPAGGDGRALWQIPLTVGFTRRPFAFWAGLQNFVKHSPLSHLHLIGIAERLGIVRRIWLNLDVTDSAEMLTLLRKLRKMNLPCICFTIHTSSLVPGKNPYSLTRADVNRIHATADEVFSALAQWEEFEPATVSEVARKLEADYDACHRT